MHTCMQNTYIYAPASLHTRECMPACNHAIMHAHACHEGNATSRRRRIVWPEPRSRAGMPRARRHIVPQWLCRREDRKACKSHQVLPRANRRKPVPGDAMSSTRSCSCSRVHALRAHNTAMSATGSGALGGGGLLRIARHARGRAPRTLSCRQPSINK